MSAMVYPPSQYVDLQHTDHGALFVNSVNVWEALTQISSYLQFRLRPAMNGRLVGRPYIGGAVYVGTGTVIEQGAMIKGPAWIGDQCEIRNGAYIRENVIVGNGAVVGNSCELKNCILFDEVQVPHFNYVGDAILGFRAHLGAGAILSNVKLDHSEIFISGPDGRLATGLRKFSAVLGDHVEVGCNSVINPGSLIGRGSILYPGTNWRGVLAEGSVVKVTRSQQVLERRENR